MQKLIGLFLGRGRSIRRLGTVRKLALGGNINSREKDGDGYEPN